MINYNDFEVWFVTGAQLLYGGDAVVQVDAHSTEMVKGLNELEHKGFTSSIIQAIKSSATTLIDKEEEDVKIFQ